MLLVVPVMPADGANGLAMRAGLLAEGLSRLAPLRIAVVPVFGQPGPPSDLVARLGARVVTVGETEADAVADFKVRLADPVLRGNVTAVHPKPVLSAVATVDVARRLAAIAEPSRGVLVMRTYLAPVLDLILAAPNRPRVIIDVDDIDSESLRSLGEFEQAIRFSALERHYLPLADLVLACSQSDVRRLADAYPDSATAVVPNAVRPPSKAPDRPPADGHDLLFVGNLSYAPNVDAVLWLCEEVMPLLGDARMALVGSGPAPAVRALAGDRVTVAADVPDVGEWYTRSRVAVAPLRSGGGTKIKVIEALAHARPVVATPEAARGLEAFAGGEGPLMLAEGTEDFARRCSELLADPPRAERLGLAGREQVIACASVDAVAERLADLAGAIFSA